MKIIVNFAKRIINVDGTLLPYDGELPEGYKFIRWYENAGQIEMLDGSVAPCKFETLQPYYDYWLAAKKAIDDRAAEERAAAEAKRKAAAAEIAAANKAIEDELARTKPMNDALDELGRHDYEVIKAMEAMLVDQGRLPKEFAEQRNALRDTVSTERAKQK
jgi:hypothetical protein